MAAAVLGRDPGTARSVCVSAPPASSATVTAGQRAQVEPPGERTRKAALDLGASADTPVRRQGLGGSLPGPGAGHPLQGTGGHGPVPPIKPSKKILIWPKDRSRKNGRKNTQTKDKHKCARPR